MACSRVIKKSGSDEDVFSAVGGMELGRHDPASGASVLQLQSATSAAEAAALPSQGSGQSLSDANLTAADGGSSFGGPAIGDLPFSETPSRTLIVRNVTASSLDQDLHQLFEVRACVQMPDLVLCKQQMPIICPCPVAAPHTTYRIHVSSPHCRCNMIAGVGHHRARVL